ncbi:MAG: lipopolysaccharide heptosyltransferase II [Candidatus Omnitrophota bacterium]
MKTKRILITRTDRLGDVVLSTPVIRFLREKYPFAYIAFMVRPENRDVVVANPDLDEVIIYDKYGKQKSFWNTFKFALKLRNKKFDMAIALHPTTRVHVMFFLADIPERIGYDRKMGRLLTLRIKHDKQKGEKHEVDYNFDVLEKIGIDTTRAVKMPYIVTTEKHKNVVLLLRKKFNISENIAVFHPGASCPSKRWSAENFGYLADKITDKYGLNAVFVGGIETEKFVKRAINVMKNKATNLAGKLNVGELAEFLSKCRVFVSNDSGPVHIAVAVKTPTVAIFGRNDRGLSPKRWGPIGKNDEVVHDSGECVECLAHNCRKDFICLKKISPEEVMKAVDRILKRAGNK